MIRWRDKPPPSEWEEMCARMLDETSAFITEALEHPELAVHIPVIQAGTGTFPPSLARAFWEPLLASE